MPVVFAMTMPETVLMIGRKAPVYGFVWQGKSVTLPYEDSLGHAIPQGSARHLLILSSLTCCTKNEFSYTGALRQSKGPLVVIWDTAGKDIYRGDVDMASRNRFLFEGLTEISLRTLFSLAPAFVSIDEQDRIVAVEPANSRVGGNR